jgi:hypothetical protein
MVLLVEFLFVALPFPKGDEDEQLPPPIALSGLQLTF